MMRPNHYAIIRRAVEDGVYCGWNEAHEETETPSPEQVQAAIVSAIMSELHEYFEFQDVES